MKRHDIAQNDFRIHKSANPLNSTPKMPRQVKSSAGPQRADSKSGPFRLIDLFSGAGGLTLGFSKQFGHNFESVWANDFDEDAGLAIQNAGQLDATSAGFSGGAPCAGNGRIAPIENKPMIETARKQCRQGLRVVDTFGSLISLHGLMPFQMSAVVGKVV